MHFNSSNVITLPGDQVVDLTDLDFSERYDRNYSKARLLETPRLMVMQYFRRDHGQDGELNALHCSWACHVAHCQINQNRGFAVVKEQDGRQWESPRALLVKEYCDVQYIPLETCKSGLISRDNYDESGVMTNVHELATTSERTRRFL